MKGQRPEMATPQFVERVVRPGLLLAVRDGDVAAHALAQAGSTGRCNIFMCWPADGNWLWNRQGADDRHDWHFHVGDSADDTHPLDAFPCCSDLRVLFHARDPEGLGRPALLALAWAEWLGLPWTACDETGGNLTPDAVRYLMRGIGAPQMVTAQRERAMQVFRKVSHVMLWTEWGSSGVWAGNEASAAAAGGMIRLCNLPIGPALIRRIAIWHAVFDDHASESPRPEDEADWIEAEQLALAQRVSLDLGKGVLVSAGLGQGAPAFRMGRLDTTRLRK